MLPKQFFTHINVFCSWTGKKKDKNWYFLESFHLFLRTNRPCLRMEFRNDEIIFEALLNIYIYMT